MKVNHFASTIGPDDLQGPWQTKAVVKNMMQDSLEFFTLDSVDDYCHGLEAVGFGKAGLISWCVHLGSFTDPDPKLRTVSYYD